MPGASVFFLLYSTFKSSFTACSRTGRKKEILLLPRHNAAFPQPDLGVKTKVSSCTPFPLRLIPTAAHPSLLDSLNNPFSNYNHPDQHRPARTPLSLSLTHTHPNTYFWPHTARRHQPPLPRGPRHPIAAVLLQFTLRCLPPGL